MTIQYHYDITQGTQEWHELRRGIITASEIKNILTPKFAVANNDKCRQLVYKKAAEIISGVVDDTFMSYEMERGSMLEPYAIEEYSKNFNQVKPCGFITNNRWGFVIGYSPDGLVGNDGLVEFKSPARKKHIQYIAGGVVPDEHIAQAQAGLLVTDRAGIDFVSYYPGMTMLPIKAKPDAEIQRSIVGAVAEFYAQVKDVVEAYKKAAKKGKMTEAIELNLDAEIEV